MKNKLTSLTIFFPAYNEEENIKKTISDADAAAQLVTNDYEIIVINDGSKDKTAEVVRSVAKDNPHVRLINHVVNKGYGGALLTGFNAAAKDWTFFSDSDGQFDMDEITKLVEHVDDHDVVIGYRIKRNDPFMRYLNAKGWNLLNRVFFGLKVADIDCAFKLFKTKALEPVLPEMLSHGAMISAELLTRLQRRGHELKEVGVHHYPRTAGSPTGAKPSVIVKAFRELMIVFYSETRKDMLKFLDNIKHSIKFASNRT